ncbi:MAG: OsmC family protein [Mailhella sp.]|nr:OsmC family protein [Mailhella sp.]
MSMEARFTLTESGTLLRTQHPLYGDIPGRFQYLGCEREKYGSPAAFLIGAVLSCYCESLGAELHRRGAFFRSIEAAGRIERAKDENGLPVVSRMDVDVNADVEDRWAGILQDCLDKVKNCPVSRSLAAGFPVSISARRA